jgi:hypothetical protein
MRAENNKPQRPAEKNPPARKTVVADAAAFIAKTPPHRGRMALRRRVYYLNYGAMVARVPNDIFVVM